MCWMGVAEAIGRHSRVGDMAAASRSTSPPESPPAMTLKVTPSSASRISQAPDMPTASPVTTATTGSMAGVAPTLSTAAREGDGLSYIGSTGVTVNLSTGDASGGDAFGDVFSGIENLRGSQYADTLTGDERSNEIYGLDGNDRLFGLGGNDWLHGGAGRRLGRWRRGAGWRELSRFGRRSHGEPRLRNGLRRSRTRRHLRQHRESRRLPICRSPRWGTSATTSCADTTATTAFSGAEAMTGCRAMRAPTFSMAARGRDGASYRDSDAGVTVNLTTGTGSGGHAQGDTLRSIENVAGSRHADQLTGDSGNNLLEGNGGR